MDRLILMLIGISIFSFVITYLLHRIFKKKIIKYIPSIIFLFFGLYNVLLARNGVAEGFEDIARVLMGIMGFTVFAAGIGTGFFLDWFIPRRRNKR